MPRPPPELTEGAIFEILLRLPPDDPASLVRAALVCKPWRVILSDPGFPRRYRDFHRSPPIIGFLRNNINSFTGSRWKGRTCSLAPIAPSNSPPLLDPELHCPGGWALDSRHGRVLMDREGGESHVLAVWDPVTGGRHVLETPGGEDDAFHHSVQSAMVLCSAANCDHCDCSGGPFLVVFVTSYGSKARAWVYSSETGAFTSVLKYDLGRHCLSVIDAPEVYDERVVLMSMDAGSLGFAGVRGSTLYLWSRKVNPMEDIGWEQHNVIELKTLFATHRLHMPLPVYVICFAEGVNALLVGTHYNTLTLELNSGRVRRKSCALMYSAEVFPIMRFYTPEKGWSQCGAAVNWSSTTSCPLVASLFFPKSTPQFHAQTLATAAQPRSAAADHFRAMALPTELVDDVTAEILLRLPPDEPEHLFRASLVCKPWLRLLSDPVFLRRYRAFHGAPPLLGVLHRLQVFDGAPKPCFTPTTAVPTFPHPGSDGRRTQALDCRHGRILIHMLDDENVDLLVWDPVTGDRHCLSEPDINWMAYSATVFCATAGCDHLDCHGGPFRVAFVGTDGDSLDGIWASVYSSETRAWSKPTHLDNGDYYYVQPRRGTLIGDEIYFTVSKSRAIVKYDWRKNCLSPCNPQPPETYKGWVTLMVMGDSSLGLAGIEDSRLYLWRRKVNVEGAAEWVQCRVIELESLIPMAGNGNIAYVVGFAEDVGTIFIKTSAGLFTIKLETGHVRKVDEPGVYFSVLPYMSFYTPGILLALAYALSCIYSFHMLA
ncbi:hypothetical protein EJB05_14312, partial [Eragrostis curvula]